MQTSLGQDVADMAAALDGDTIHVWQLRYERTQRREPLRALLGAYLGLSADAVAFVEGEHGRPELAEPWNRHLQFNWSHSGDIALVALARGIVPGIDVERLRPRAHAMEIAERFFHPDETSALTALDDAQRDQGFLQLWTGKEAVLKAMGRGIAFGLDRLRLTVSPATPQLIWLDGDDATQWQLQPISLNAGYVACVAWRGPAQAIVMGTLADSA
ncbi:4'-phosphopantetheinyl transferase superfamily protein [Dyella sp. 2HG41-7]|uniref:4'-phosphopantetheinyl transferase family protein n=1 Tax=Dyella sp. 2HG41-7 TaxID=2883239 RepID=UPI001F472EBE|nr:4'-phosphopantetheinyl transferase superfamily protein [Dyella sp. 2HG41-7]